MHLSLHQLAYQCINCLLSPITPCIIAHQCIVCSVPPSPFPNILLSPTVSLHQMFCSAPPSMHCLTICISSFTNALFCSAPTISLHQCIVLLSPHHLPSPMHCFAQPPPSPFTNALFCSAPTISLHQCIVLLLVKKS